MKKYSKGKRIYEKEFVPFVGEVIEMLTDSEIGRKLTAKKTKTNL